MADLPATSRGKMSGGSLAVVHSWFGSHAPGVAAFVDEFPEVFGFGQGLILGERHVGAEEEIGEGAFVEDAMDDDVVVLDLEIKPVFEGPKAVERAAFAFNFTEALAVEFFQILACDLELVDKLELVEGAEAGELCGADFIEDDLQHGGNLGGCREEEKQECTGSQQHGMSWFLHCYVTSTTNFCISRSGGCLLTPGSSALALGAGHREHTFMFTPKWKKEAQHLAKASRKFVHYKRDLLKPDRLAEIKSRQDDLQSAVRAGDRAKVDEASKHLRATCENSLPYEKPLNWLEENVEVMFVAVVIALGLRAYYLQPFRIPTGSMQPTLNGIIGTPLPQAEWPSFPQRMAEKVLRGRSYVKVVNDEDRRVAMVLRESGPDFDVRDVQRMHFFSRGEIHFSDSKPIQLPAPRNPSLDAGLRDALHLANRNGGVIPKGTVLCEGTIDTGDLVLVDKFSYHFRTPKRGEVFVFDTIGIKGIHERSGDQAAGSHYIKRLCGVPGDVLSIDPPNLLIDGRIPKEEGIRRVAEGKGAFALNPGGYGFAGLEGVVRGRTLTQYMAKPGDELALRDQTKPGMREYAALGDNTRNSLDSRYWGTVKEFNLVGPAMISLWPITTGHWGFIR